MASQDVAVSSNTRSVAAAGVEAASATRLCIDGELLAGIDADVIFGVERPTVD